MEQPVYKPESECSQAELFAWRRLRVAGAALRGGAAAAAVLTVLGLVSQFPDWSVFALVCAMCAAAAGLATRFLTHVPSPLLQEAMRDIRSAGGSPSGERMIDTWKCHGKQV